MTKHCYTTYHPRRAAATGAALLALFGASTAPSHALLASTSAASCAQPGRSTRQRAGSDLRSSMTPVAVASPEGQPSSTARAVPAVPAAEVNLEAGGTPERRWINDVKSGDKVIGYVTDTAAFAAFVDVGVVRKGSQGKVVPVPGFLHLSEIRDPYALENTARAKKCELEVKKGIHLTAYIKDVFLNAGRLTLSLDPSINKDKVLRMRGVKRKRSQIARRERLAENRPVPGIGDVTEGYVRQVQEEWLLIDVMHAQLSVLRAGKIRRVTGEGHINLREKVKAGDRVTVRIQDVVGDTLRGKDGDKAIIEFVGWGGIDKQTESVKSDVVAQEVDMVSSFADAKDQELDGQEHQEDRDAMVDDHNTELVEDMENEAGDDDDEEDGGKDGDMALQ